MSPTPAYRGTMSRLQECIEMAEALAPGARVVFEPYEPDEDEDNTESYVPKYQAAVELAGGEAVPSDQEGAEMLTGEGDTPEDALRALHDVLVAETRLTMERLSKALPSISL